MSLSLATRIPFSVLVCEEDRTLATYLQLLDEQAEEYERARSS